MDGRLWATILAAASLALAGCIDLPQDDAQHDDTQDTDASHPDSATPSATFETECRPLDMSGGYTGGQGTSGQGGATNTPGAFSYGGQNLLRTDTETHMWQNPTTSATLSWGGQSLTGQLTIRIYDACDTLLLEHDIRMLEQNGSHALTDPGTPGEWRIELDWQLYTGQTGLTITSA